MPGPYQLYLIRHGIAEERSDAWPDDAKRPLTESGISRLRKSIRGLLRAGVSFDVVLTSPLVRTRQSAEVVAAGVSPRPPIVAVDSLAPAGHEPGIGELAARLAGSRHAFEFKKGGVCRIDVDSLPIEGPGTLVWFLTPRIMRALKK